MHPSVYTFREVRVPLWRYRAPVGIRGIDNDDNDSNSSNNNKLPSISCKYILYVGLRYEVRARRVPPIPGHTVHTGQWSTNGLRFV